ncbi:hypothetical protein ACFFVB_12845 [Formosa undariae]|uniref:PKD/Chitinase domain-containing protein n=1 Tax=Formosa undariae TaxID=1325436 RepID=A0ABV5F3G8_9FLAO
MMKFIKYAFSLAVIALIAIGCSEDDNTDYVNAIAAPTNVSASVRVTQDNTGLVTITPLAEGAVSYDVSFGDGSEKEVNITPGKGAMHVYAEGTYEATITAISLNGLTTEASQSVVVSFKTPENLVVTIENDPAISKQVNISATADFATGFEVYFGEDDAADPMPLNVDETISYQYEDAGTYTIKVVAMSAAAETTEYSEAFVVTAILQPLEAAPVPIRAQADVISIYSDSYTNPESIDYNPNWGQSTTYTEIQVGGNNTIQYGDITYQGIDFSGAPVNASAMEFVHIDVWTAEADFNALLFPITAAADGATSETSYELELKQDEWTSFEIPLSVFTAANGSLDFSNTIQFKLEGLPSGSGTIFIDNLFFYKVPSGIDTGLVGTWKLSSAAGSLGVGPAVGDITWWNCDADCVTDRACYYDDTYVFSADGTFKNVMGDATWVESWQGGSDSCGVPVAPHDGSNAATYVYNEDINSITLNGKGAFIGLSKGTNSGELTSPADAPDSITYSAAFSDPNTIQVSIETGTGSGTFWQFTLVREGVVSSPLTGTWQMSQDAGSLGVGPSVGDVSWWNCDDACVTERACYYDDAYVFGADGTFKNEFGGSTWLESWLGGTDGCGTPIAPFDGSIAATYTYSGGVLTINGKGSFIGLAKANNEGELSNAADAPDAITYNVTFIDNNTISVAVETGTGSGTFWQYKLVRI